MMEDDEILQDFLVEAGEILDQLGSQLIELEQRGGDSDLLNAIFRGFHTVKGGASFLGLQPMVEVCHRAEDVFNALRQNERQVDSALTDTVLQALDAVNAMFEDVRGGANPRPPSPALLDVMDALLSGPTPVVDKPAVDAADAEFDALLNEAPTDRAPDNQEISDQEFEHLLDAMHGPGRHQGVPAAPGKGAVPHSKPPNEMSEDEFESLLDSLHGEHSAPGQLDAHAPSSSESRKAPIARDAPAAESGSQREAESSIRVNTRRLDDIMNLVGELVLVRNRLSTLKGEIDDGRVAKAVFDLDTVTVGLQDAAMQTRMQPVKKVFGRFPRVVRDLARALGKEVTLEMRGEETDLDKNLVDALADPLVHLVRNAVDHGIETSTDRLAAGKSSQGHILLSAAQEGDHILLTIEDDGGGMDPALLKARAVERGLITAEIAERMSDHDAFDLIFAAGFSTRVEVSDVSGRGVGMDVVKTSIGRLNGTIRIDSELGRGSRIQIQVPLTLAILPTLMVAVGRQQFAVPLSCVGEIFNFDRNRVHTVEGREVVLVRNQPVPVFYLNRWLATETAAAEPGQTEQVILLQAANQRVAFVVDAVFDQEEVVIKPLGAGLHGLSGFAGATITGDGGIALILDVASLVLSRTRRAA